MIIQTISSCNFLMSTSGSCRKSATTDDVFHRNHRPIYPSSRATSARQCASPSPRSTAIGGLLCVGFLDRGYATPLSRLWRGRGEQFVGVPRAACRSRSLFGSHSSFVGPLRHAWDDRAERTQGSYCYQVPSATQICIAIVSFEQVYTNISSVTIVYGQTTTISRDRPHRIMVK